MSRKKTRRRGKPRTGETFEGLLTGRERVQRIAARHPLSAQVFIMTQPERVGQERFIASFIEDLRPSGFVELQLAQSAAMDQWRLNHYRAIEQNLYSDPLTNRFANTLLTVNPEIHTAVMEAKTFADSHKVFAQLSLVMQRVEHSYERNLRLLRERQTDRAQSKPKTMAAGQGAASDPAADPIRDSTVNPPSGAAVPNILNTSAPPHNPTMN